ncbi:MAG TPA: prepilin-type N-terminal cleavage/methylation domain-containing protein [Opitutaceae bacterium]|nr:prepilin-type N-terminal cleavage/methylation domain-containing protein [Opitutaceae bacterium]
MHRSRRGFTLVEVLLVLLVLGLVASMLTGGFSGLLPLGRETVAVTKAREINGARRTYALIVPDAAAQWAAATADTDKVMLLINAKLLNGTAADQLTLPGDYTLSLAGAMRDKTVLKKGTATLDYTE